MKNIITIFLVMISTSLYAQNTDWDTLLNLVNQLGLEKLDLEQFLERKKRKEIKKRKIYANCDLKRMQFGKSVQSIYSIKKNEKKKKSKFYFLNYFTLGSKIIYVRLAENKTNNEIIERSTLEFEKLKHDYLGDLVSQKDENHKYFNPSGLVIVGLACGYAGRASKHFYEIEELVLQKDKVEVLHWCKSLSPEIRYFGAIGLSCLKSNGVKLSAEEEQILKSISKEKTIIYTCNGCTDWGMTNSLSSMIPLGKQFLQSRTK